MISISIVKYKEVPLHLACRCVYDVNFYNRHGRDRLKCTYNMRVVPKIAKTSDVVRLIEDKGRRINATKGTSNLHLNYVSEIKYYLSLNK